MKSTPRWPIGCALLALAGTGSPALAQGANVDMRSAQAVSIDYVLANPGQHYRLQTWFLQGENKCLQGNLPDRSLFLSTTTAAFQLDCQNVPGQLWKIIPAGNGYFRLQTIQSAEVNRCLEGNQLNPRSVMGGAAFMDDCKPATGQFWKFVDAGKGYYRLQTQFLEQRNACLEGNKRGENWMNAVLFGASHMTECKNVSGQFWKIVMASGGSAPPPPPRQRVLPQPRREAEKALD